MNKCPNCEKDLIDDNRFCNMECAIAYNEKLKQKTISFKMMLWREAKEDPEYHDETEYEITMTLHGKQQFIQKKGGPTDEGWHSNAETYEFDGEELTLETFSDGCDCDGPLSTGNKVRCSVENVAAGVDGFPLWERIPKAGWRRDAYAEAAGY